MLGTNCAVFFLKITQDAHLVQLAKHPLSIAPHADCWIFATFPLIGQSWSRV